MGLAEIRSHWERFQVLWCGAVHDNITWPQKGWYRCRICGRYWAVPWRAAVLYGETEPRVDAGSATFAPSALMAGRGRNAWERLFGKDRSVPGVMLK